MLICRSGARAGQAGRALAAAGLPHLRVLDGMLAWERTSAPVRRGAPRWDPERQVRLVAGSVVRVSVLGSMLVPGLKWVAALLGTGLIVAALTDTCALGLLLGRLPYHRGAGGDLDGVVATLRGDTGRQG
ncbi:Protein of unknown function (DUF2892) [Micromonospora matsumotoense]|uniref:Rhodanese domain-containing protein n=1 Tax=Micromonospora matsumotoense TaxID=121616 RepID=A0A1C4UZQ1_9ACTN|nr:Protein of unknown function (DUF2892) [Micromonospora matsumotoense]